MQQIINIRILPLRNETLLSTPWKRTQRVSGAPAYFLGGIFFTLSNILKIPWYTEDEENQES